MIHLLFSQSTAGCLKITLSQMGLGNTHNVYSLWDQFSVGPIKDLHVEKGLNERFRWKHTHLTNEWNELEECERNYKKMWVGLDKIPKGEPITMWVGENAHEQTGLRYGVFLLKERKDIDLFVINTTEKYIKLFKQPKRFYIPYNSAEIPPEKMAVIYDYSKYDPPLTDHERDDLISDWKNASTENELLRLWRVGRLEGASEDTFDSFILDTVKKLMSDKNHEYMKAGRVVGDVIGHIDQTVGDTFIEYRLRNLIEIGALEAEGDLGSMRHYAVRLPR
ncbi:DUF1835 domain-containing protein [Rossellomorea aquimaris]|uniref:DUF1835 domain-containing protein n=1 Tax=Rossellomorea aquimaris TaxID=189382 RepID=UPI001CD2A429|nr:DUF1835 domain-containing protein [Rossellomorea aquimaris]MCA1055688.1 DUF1835 domain-containing protein [Rossellomorea aquimaris]